MRPLAALLCSTQNDISEGSCSLHLAALLQTLVTKGTLVLVAKGLLVTGKFRGFRISYMLMETACELLPVQQDITE